MPEKQNYQLDIEWAYNRAKTLDLEIDPDEIERFLERVAIYLELDLRNDNYSVDTARNDAFDLIFLKKSNI